MKRFLGHQFFAVLCLGLAVMGHVVAAAEISERDITDLQEELAEAAAASSATRMRRAYKGVARDGEKLYKSAVDGPERWQVLEIVFQSQKRLLALEKSNSNRDALLETCTQLAKAPAEVADLRLEADLLLSERNLSTRNASVTERAEALEELIARYRDTPGEARSLMLTSQIAPKLEAFDLEMRILRSMQERFADHHGIIEFRRKSLAAGRIEALFRGRFAKADGTEIIFPVDRLGHPAIVVFWSEKTQGFETALQQIDEHRTAHPDRFDFFSFNLDELPDSGAATLKSMNLDWIAMRLPGGKQAQTFRTYGQREPVSILINAYGYTLLTANNNYGRGHGGKPINPYRIEDTRITSERYLAQLQSLFIGDFLVENGEAIPPAVQNCFVPVPLRYRLTREQSLNNYKKVAQLCRKAANAPEDLRLRSRHIIALLGQWKFTTDASHFDAAVTEARALLSTPELPAESEVVARFCLAKDALRRGELNAEGILSNLVTTCNNHPLAIGAAAILALDASSRELHQHYREILLAEHADDPALWTITTFLRDRFHRLDLLKVKLTRGERRIRAQYGETIGPRTHAINHSLEPMTNRMPKVELKTLDGKALNVPFAGTKKLTLLMFIEPPANPTNAFPVILGGTPAVGKKAGRPGVMQYAFEFADRHIHGELEVIAAFLSDDAERVRGLMATNGWPCTAALVPGGLQNPMVRQLGILSADRIPNVFLLRRDGSIAWHSSGFNYKSDFGYPFAMRLAMKVHTEKCDTELAFRALAAGEFAEAKRVFSGPFLPEKDERYAWRAPRFHGRAMANVGLKDWPAALADIDIAIESHRKEFDHPNGMCGSMLNLQKARNAILTKLGRADDVDPLKPIEPNADLNIYEQFHHRLESWRETHETN